MRVLIVDDHALVRAGLRMLVESIPGTSVVAEAADGFEALRLILQHDPDVVLLDVAMPGLNGLETLRRARAVRPGTRALVVSMHGDEAYVREALSAGAAGYLLKGADRAELEHALRVVASNQTYISPAIAKTVATALARGGSAIAKSRLALLTIRQLEVLRLLALGNSTKEMATELGLSTKTVEAHRSAVMQRLGIQDLAGLVRFAMREGIISPE